MCCRGCTNALARDCGGLKFLRTGHGFRLKEVRIGYLDRLDIVVRDDHPRAALREMPDGRRLNPLPSRSCLTFLLGQYCPQISSPQLTRSYGVLEIAAARLRSLSVATAVV
jgi:hypothetical protein